MAYIISEGENLRKPLRQIQVTLFGIGGVGQALLEQLLAHQEVLFERVELRFAITAVIDSRSWIWKDGGLDNRQIADLIQRKKAGATLGMAKPELPEIWDRTARGNWKFGIVVDTTAADGMGEVIDGALNRGLAVVLANKKPLTGSWGQCGRFYNNALVRYEATTGGGLPVIAALRTLQDTGDTIRSIEGRMSGTMSMITRRMDEGLSFSQALSEAMASGVTEPDPREDLSGLDVMRKLLIMGRTAGWPLEQNDIEVESLVPPPLTKLPLDQFMDSVNSLNRSLADWARAASSSGMVLRYLARVIPSRGEVGLLAIPTSSPLATSKMFAIQSDRYNEEPLFIGSNTSGVKTTAAGVLGDMISLVRETGG